MFDIFIGLSLMFVLFAFWDTYVRKCSDKCKYDCSKCKIFDCPGKYCYEKRK